MVHHIHSIVQWWMWIAFTFGILILIAVDLSFSAGNRWHRISTKEAIGWSLFWFTLAIIFNFLLWLHLYHTKPLAYANEHAAAFFTGYLVEELISIENMLVFLLIIHQFKVPEIYHRKILLYGVIGVIISRFIMMMFGVWIIARFHWVYYIFGAFLVYSGISMFFYLRKRRGDARNSRILQWVNRRFETTPEYHAKKIVYLENKHWILTPLFTVVLLLQISDIVFAVDSIPAIFGITKDPFIIYTSNILAVLGLRSLYFLIEGIRGRLYLLKYCISIILVYIGIKMLISPWYTISIYYTLGFVLFVLLASVVLSITIKPINKPIKQ